MGHVPSPPLLGGRASHDADRESLLTRPACAELRGAPVAGNRVNLLALGGEGIFEARASNWTLDAQAFGPVGEYRVIGLVGTTLVKEQGPGLAGASGTPPPGVTAGPDPEG